MSNYDLYPEIRPQDAAEIDKCLRIAALAKSTNNSYRWTLRRLARFLASKQLTFEDVTPEIYLDFLDSNDWGDNMRALALMAAKKFYKFKFGKKHPIFILEVKKPAPKPQRTLSFEEVEQLLASIDVSKPRGVRNYSIVTLMLDTGLRSAEVCNLAVKHLDLDNNTLQTMIKGGQWGTGIYTQKTANALLDWLTLRQEYAAPDVRNVYVGILGSTPGEQMTTSGLRSIFRKMGERADLEGLSPHVLRRTFATLAIEAGAPTRTVQMAGRWKSLQMVERYTQALQQKSITDYLPTNQVSDDND